MRATLVALCGTLTIAVTACGTDRPAAETAVREADPGTLHAGDPVPIPSGAPTLRVRGVQGGNDGAETLLDLATIDRLPRVETTIDEPFQNRTMTFTGVRVDQLLRIAGVPAGRTRVRMHALDDYQVDFRLQDLADTGAVLATRVDGERIPLEDGGPIRIVFPTRDGVGENKDNWIWSLDWIRVDA